MIVPNNKTSHVALQRNYLMIIPYLAAQRLIPAHNQRRSSQFIHDGAEHLSHPMKSNYSNTAQLKDLMTVPPMTAAQHAEVMRKRIAHRRMVEEARDLKRASAHQFDQR
ncbi:hypothetical protein BA896_008780 [Janthinobacterium lividum]|uniref:Uncharacterized protein n=1 Tax=Janthinobacterium lividum TaxID=29581 RepID=A0A1E8PRR6_9BURK|nr:hypothetical protein BA896_008780 [Janthinobacterium lividum]